MAEGYKDVLGCGCYLDGDGGSRVCDIKAYQIVQLICRCTCTGLKEGGWVVCDSAGGVHRSVDCFQKIRLGEREGDLSCIYPGSAVLKPSIACLTHGEGGMDLKTPATLCSLHIFSRRPSWTCTQEPCLSGSTL